MSDSFYKFVQVPRAILAAKNSSDTCHHIVIIVEKTSPKFGCLVARVNQTASLWMCQLLAKIKQRVCILLVPRAMGNIFCLVSGLKFGVENPTDYNKAKYPIPFRRRVFSSNLDGRPVRGKDVGLLIESDVFKKLDDNDAVSLCCVGIFQLVLLGVEDRRPIPNWILRLANDRVSWDNYPWGSYVWPTLYKHLRDANVKRWQPLYVSDPTNETDTKSYSIECFAWAFKTWILEFFRAATNDYYTRYRRHPRIVAWSLKHKFYRHMLKPMLHVRQLPVERLVPDETEARSRWWVSSRAYFDGRSFKDEHIPRHLNRNNYFEVPSEMYREFKEQRRGYQQMKEKNDDMREQSWPEGWLSSDHMDSWIQILIRERTENANWTLAKSGTVCLHQENNRFMILMDPHNIETLDGSVRPFPSWNDVTWVYMPINAGGVHWVTGAINLADSIFYVFDSMESESRMLILEQQVNNWTPVINNIFETCGYFNGTRGQPHNFRFSYNELFGYQVPQQKNAKDCGVIKCWLITNLCLGQAPTVVNDSQVY
nr:phospholipase-like protein [Tanacetum cinerariifolium]